MDQVDKPHEQQRAALASTVLTGDAQIRTRARRLAAVAVDLGLIWPTGNN